MKTLALGIALGLFAVSVENGAATVPPRANTPASHASLSIGSPNEGRLDGGTRLPTAPYLRVVPFYAESNARWGLPSLVGLLDRAARRVAHRFPDAVLNVGDLSRKGGGEIERHHSHESGRDADLGFYLRNQAGKPMLPAQFVSFTNTGGAKNIKGAYFDDARNWALIEALADDPVTRVARIFVAAHIRARLLRFAEKNGVDAQLRERAAELMAQPRRAPHDDHFHVRIACPKSQEGTCIEDAVAISHHARPPVAHVRRRAGTDHATRGLPPLSGVTPANVVDVPGLRGAEQLEPLANANETDALVR